MLSETNTRGWGDPGRLVELFSGIVNVREYAQEAVSPDLLELVFEAFRHGPSIANTQPAEIIRVGATETALREKVGKATLDAFMRPGSLGGQEWVQDAPELLVVVTELRRAEARLGPLGRAAATQFAFASIQNLRVMASSLRLGSACITEFAPEPLRAALGLPWYVEPVAIVTLGYPRGPVERPARLSVGEIVHQNGWLGGRGGGTLGVGGNAMGKPAGESPVSESPVSGSLVTVAPGSMAPVARPPMTGALPLRRSVRSFRADPVPVEVLQTALADACRAPSSGNMQPWEFIMVDDKGSKEKLVATTYTGYEKNTASPQNWMLSAPLIVAICANLERTRARYGPDGDNWAPLDGAAAAENFLLSLAALGLGSCWVGGFDAGQASRVLGLPAHVLLIGLFPVGYPDERLAGAGAGAPKMPAPWLKPRISPRLVTHHNFFDTPYWTLEP